MNITQHILIVEDNAIILELLDTLFTGEGYSVTAVADGDEAKAALEYERPDIILTDIVMPTVDGFGVLNAVRSHPELAHIPVIMLSAKSRTEEIRFAMNQGADDYVTKPFEAEKLLEAVRIRIQRCKEKRRWMRWYLDNINYYLTRTIPHEIFTPISQITVAMDILQRDFYVMQREDMAELYNLVLSATDRLVHISSNFSMYASIQNEIENVHRDKPIQYSAPFNAAALVEKTVQMCAEKFQRTSDYVCVADESVWLTLFFPYFEKLVAELCRNAFTYSMPGTMVWITAGLDKTRSKYILSISNQGRGLNAAQVAILREQFTVFVQFDREYYEQQGTGLGLAFVKSVAKLYKGTFSITSSPGIGTTVWVGFPLTSDIFVTMESENTMTDNINNDSTTTTVHNTHIHQQTDSR
ncbi:MAG: response regulator [Ignavibacteria bacterium]|nr:response regulator [Ignavibacteria bacterium]